MGNKIVIALGGNALGNTASEQAVLVKETVKAIADLIEAGHQVTISHGNGPQVGMIQKAMTALHNQDPSKYEIVPLDICSAMSQGYIGYDLDRALRVELTNRGINKMITNVLTQTEVDINDPAFENPAKPIGSYITKEAAEKLTATRGFIYKEYEGKGFRRVVPSPIPKDIVEIESIKNMIENGHVVIACGGGGIPVVKDEEGNYVGLEAVIDKDFASELLAELIDADYLIILTAVEKVAINFGKPNQEWLSNLTVKKAYELIEEGHFEPGSMLPKVEAAIRFAESKNGRKSLITLLEKAKDGIEGKTGTEIIAE